MLVLQVAFALEDRQEVPKLKEVRLVRFLTVPWLFGEDSLSNFDKRQVRGCKSCRSCFGKVPCKMNFMTVVFLFVVHFDFAMLFAWCLITRSSVLASWSLTLRRHCKMAMAKWLKVCTVCMSRCSEAQLMCPNFRSVSAHAFHIKTAVLRRVYADVRAHRKIGTAILKPDVCGYVCTILIHCDPFCTYRYWCPQENCCA